MINIAKKKISGVLIPAGCVIGVGVGMLTGQVAAGALIGLGVGFLAYFGVEMKEKKKAQR